MFLEVVKTIICCTNAALNPKPEFKLPLTKDGRSLYEIMKKRVLYRYKSKCKAMGITPKDINFDKLFDLPDWITFDQWMSIQLRGRDVNDIFDLNTDHILPLSVANDLDELKKLMSWKNTRLLDPDLNTEKASHLDKENILLGERLLGRKIDTKNWNGVLGRTVELTPVERLKKFKNRRKFN